MQPQDHPAAVDRPYRLGGCAYWRVCLLEGVPCLQMIACAADPWQEPTAADDADTAAWMDVHQVKASGACSVDLTAAKAADESLS